MGLLRSAVVVGAVVALLPSDKDNQARVFENAATAARWAITFCDRNGESCQRGAELWTVFRAKAQFAAHIVYDVASQSIDQAQTAAGQPAEAAQPAPAPVAPAKLEGADAGAVRRGTLTDHDLQPAFRVSLRRPNA